MRFDLVIVGAGPAGLAAAIRYAQRCRDEEKACRVCVLEKGSEVGAHILSGAVIDPIAFNELLPDDNLFEVPSATPVTADTFYWLRAKQALRLPTPKSMQNEGNVIISLGQLCRHLARVAETLGVEVYPGFAATALLYNEAGEVCGVKTGDMGIDRQGHKKSSFQPGVDIMGHYTLLAEGARGSLSQSVIKRFELDAAVCPQTYGIGIKELWQLSDETAQQGQVVHTVGWPLDAQTYGGSFAYHLPDNLLSIGFVIGLDYKNPYLDPYRTFQQLKHHTYFRTLLAGGRCISYGARALTEGGLQAIPRLVFPGGALIGCSAGFMNVPRIKGSHTAMKSGMLAAEAAFDAIGRDDCDRVLSGYTNTLKTSWVWDELYRARNIRPAFNAGLYVGMAYSAIDTYWLRGRAFWTFKHHADHQQLKKIAQCRPIDYPQPDGIVSFDKLTNLARSNIFHEEDQPCHLKLTDATQPVTVNYPDYGLPESKYCPANVYEWVEETPGQGYLQINAQNCLHCKTCDIKDMTQNIEWTPPEGGGGPNYSNM